MKFTAEDCKRLTGTDQPSFYTTPADPMKCKNLNPFGPTPCWHPHCDCMGPPYRGAPERAATFLAAIVAALMMMLVIALIMHFWRS